MRKVFIQTFGCRASQADGAAIEALLEDKGYVSIGEKSEADLIVVNTCTVTHSADVDARRVIRGMHRDAPAAQILVTGCYAQRAPEELASLDGVQWVVGNSNKSQIAEIIADSPEQYHGQVITDDIANIRRFEATPVKACREDRTRPNLKIQDGCSNRCSFCIIPSVRGSSRSAPLESVVGQVADLSQRYCEVVLTGINLGRWGRDLAGRQRFPDLLRVILSRTSIARLRLSSVEPMDWCEELFVLIAEEPRIAQHIHMPLQSGCDAVLKRMFRKYRTRHYSARLALAQRYLPNAAVGADVMAGFPDESDAEFEQTIHFIEQHPFTYLHVFSYSERPGTAAAAYSKPVPIHIRQERTNRLRDLSSRKNLEFRCKMVGRTLSCVTLEQGNAALSSNFLKVQMDQDRKANQLVDLEIGAVTASGLQERQKFPIL